MKKPKVIINEHDVIEYHEIDGLLYVEGLTLEEIKKAYEEMIDALLYVLDNAGSLELDSGTVRIILNALKKAGCTE